MKLQSEQCRVLRNKELRCLYGSRGIFRIVCDGLSM